MSDAYVTTEFGDHWQSPPRESHVVDLRFDHNLFDRPLTKTSLVEFTEFSGSLIVRMPGYGNPIPLTPGEWALLESHIGVVAPAESPKRSDIVITSRPLGSVPSATETSTPPGTRAITYPEAGLVKQYERHVGHELRSLTALLPTDEKLVCDAFDPETNLIIEAKSSTRRSDVRMAIGQLLDCRHYIKSTAAIAVLLPGRPAESVVELLRAQDVKLIYRNGGTFVGPA